MTDEDPSQDRIAELIARINQMDEMLRQQAWRLYHLERRLGVVPPPPLQPTARPPHPAPGAPVAPPAVPPPFVAKNTLTGPPPLSPEAKPPTPPATETTAETRPVAPRVTQTPIAPPQTTTPPETRSEEITRREAMQTLMGARPPAPPQPP